MSDRTNHDRVHDTLTALRRDTDGLPLAGSAAARRRGAQRTRRQAVGGVVAASVLLAGAVGVGSQLGGTTKSAPIPPASQVPTTSVATTTPPTPPTQTPTTAPTQTQTRRRPRRRPAGAARGQLAAAHRRHRQDRALLRVP
jgi:negative regulator of sigma E activity